MLIFGIDIWCLTIKHPQTKENEGRTTRSKKKNK